MKSHVSEGAASKRSSKEMQAALQLLLIVASFVVGYVPFTGELKGTLLLVSRALFLSSVVENHHRLAIAKV